VTKASKLFHTHAHAPRTIAFGEILKIKASEGRALPALPKTEAQSQPAGRVEANANE